MPLFWDAKLIDIASHAKQLLDKLPPQKKNSHRSLRKPLRRPCMPLFGDATILSTTAARAPMARHRGDQPRAAGDLRSARQQK